MVGGYLSLFYSISERPLEYWRKRQSQAGCIRKILDSDLLENVLEIQDIEQSTTTDTSILCPDLDQILDIRLPILVIILKNLNVACRFQVQVIDSQNLRYHFQFNNADTEKELKRNPIRDPLLCRVKFQLEPGWNKLEVDLRKLTESAFKQQYLATQKIEICANCRLRRIYFIDKHYKDREISSELCQGFLDFYMQKWGIRTVDKSVQTDSKTSKNWKRSKESGKLIGMRGFVGDKHSIKSESGNLFNVIEKKLSELINDICNRRNVMLPSVRDLKKLTKPKSYVLPVLRDKQAHFCADILTTDIESNFNVDNWKHFHFTMATNMPSISRVSSNHPICAEAKQEENSKVPSY